MISQEMKHLQAKRNSVRLRMLGSGLKVDKVFGERVLIKVVKPYTEMDRAKQAGLALPQDAEERNTPLPSTGIVVMVGDGWYKSDTHGTPDCPVAEGDMIMFSKYAGSDYRVDEEDFKILSMSEVVARVVPAQEGGFVAEEIP
jgi:chaperonin GroES